MSLSHHNQSHLNKTTDPSHFIKHVPRTQNYSYTLFQPTGSMREQLKALKRQPWMTVLADDGDVEA